MVNPALRSELIQTHIDDLHRATFAVRLRSTAQCQPPLRQSGAVAGARPGGPTERPARRFVRHYAEMVAVMFIGMFALMAPAGWLFSAFGTSWSRLSPAMYMFAMALTMTVPMVAWMRYRGHAWRANVEMAASMLIPTFAVMGLLWAGAGSSDSLMVPEHAAMLCCMLAAMLLRRDEYSEGHHGHTRPAVAL